MQTETDYAMQIHGPPITEKNNMCTQTHAESNEIIKPVQETTISNL